MRRAWSLAFVIRRLRLGSGLILFAYVTTHLLNHAVGLVSLDALEYARHWFLGFWAPKPVSAVLYGALLAHFLLALWAVYQRRRLVRMPPLEATQLVLGLFIVPLLAQHVIGTRLAFEVFDAQDPYTNVLLVLWHLSPDKGAWQAAALCVAWLHGCLGLYFWLRLRPWYPRWQPYLYAGAILVPVLALLGFTVAGREVSRLALDPAWVEAFRIAIKAPNPDAVAWLQQIERQVYVAFAASLAMPLLARGVRFALEKRRGLVRIAYPDGREVQIPPGLTVLEVSQLHGIAHTSVCGGRGRCSTCRVMITRGGENLPPPSPGEEAVLKRVGAPPGVRLACQTRPHHDIAVVPLVPPGAGAAAGFRRPAHINGQEREIAILFADLRGFTQLSEHKLPYDVVFVLNRYFAAMGQAIERSGGRVDKFIGDGVMALFGVEGDTAQACRQALTAAREMSRTLDDLNHTLAHDLERPLRIGIGVHVGPAIVGEMGYSRATSVTAIGDAVNTASRLESLTKEFSAELVVSEDVASRAGVDLGRFPLESTPIRGRDQALSIRVVGRAQDLPLDDDVR